MDVCTGALTDEIKALKLTISKFVIGLYISFMGYGLVSFTQYRYIVRNQHQLLKCKTSKWHLLLFKKSYCFRIIIKNLTKCNILNTLRSKIMENLPTL